MVKPGLILPHFLWTVPFQVPPVFQDTAFFLSLALAQNGAVRLVGSRGLLVPLSAYFVGWGF